MAVTVNVITESLRTGTSDPMTWSHAGTGTPRGILVGFMHGTSSTDHVVSVTYGGSSLTRLQRNTDATTEPGAAEWWFLGTNVPTGTQTVSTDLASATTDDIHGVSITLAADCDLESLDVGGIDGNTANPSVALTNSTGQSAMSFAAFYSGLTAISSITAGASCTQFTTSELAGNFCSVCERQTTASTSNFTVAATSATDDCAFAAVMIAEKAPVAAITGTITATVNEGDIVAGGKTTIITLTNDEWIAAGAGSFDLQRDEIIAGCDSAQSETLGWDLVPKALQSLGGVVRTSNTVVTITWDAFATYDITAQETITVTVPSTAVVRAQTIVATPTFTVDPVVTSVPYPTLEHGIRGLERGLVTGAYN